MVREPWTTWQGTFQELGIWLFRLVCFLPRDHVFCAYCCGTVDPETRRQAEEAVKACQQQIAMCEEERKTLDDRKAQYKAEEVEVDARLSDIKKRKDLITQVESRKVSMQNRLSTCFWNFFLVFRSTHINISILSLLFKNGSPNN